MSAADEGGIYASRVSQLDALTLDSELENLLKGLLDGILNKIHGNRWAQEAELALSFLIWKFSVFDKNSSIGQRLLGLEYPNNVKRRLIGLFLLDKLLPYVQRKIAQLTSSSYRILWNYVENCLKSFQLLNLLAFLMQNHYPSFSHRIARLPMKSIAGKAQASVEYSYQIRELLWHQFADILMMVLPLINLYRVMTYFSKQAVKVKDSTKEMPSNSSSSSKTNTSCCHCKENPTIPIEFGNCTFCYYCLKANQKSDPNFQCTLH